MGAVPVGSARKLQALYRDYVFRLGALHTYSGTALDPRKDVLRMFVEDLNRHQDNALQMAITMFDATRFFKPGAANHDN